MIAPRPNPGFTREIHIKLKRLVLAENHPWFNNKLALQNGQYALGIYNEIADLSATKELFRDLDTFIRNNDTRNAPSFFLGVFARPALTTDIQFQKLMEHQLILLSQENKQFYESRGKVQPHPQFGTYSFGLNGEVLHIIGLHSKSLRRERRFDHPMLIFSRGTTPRALHV